MRLEGSCHCRGVRFTVESHTPYPFMRCYCSICRKTQGGGGYAINIMGDAATLAVRGKQNVAVYRARLREPGAAHAVHEVAQRQRLADVGRRVERAARVDRMHGLRDQPRRERNGFAGQSVGAIVLPLMLFHQIQLMLCAWLARRFAARKTEINPHPATGTA